VYGPGIDMPVRMQLGSGVGNKFFYARRIPGSITALTDNTGNLVESYDYKVFGETRIFDGGGTDITVASNGLGNQGNPYMYHGRRKEENGLYFFRARYLDTVLGRFLQKDPKGDFAGSNLGNGQAFCGNNPVNRIDPFGLDDKKYFKSVPLGFWGGIKLFLSTAYDRLEKNMGELASQLDGTADKEALRQGIKTYFSKIKKNPSLQTVFPSSAACGKEFGEAWYDGRSDGMIVSATPTVMTIVELGSPFVTSRAIQHFDYNLKLGRASRVAVKVAEKEAARLASVLSKKKQPGVINVFVDIDRLGNVYIARSKHGMGIKEFTEKCQKLVDRPRLANMRRWPPHNCGEIPNLNTAIMNGRPINRFASASTIVKSRRGLPTGTHWHRCPECIISTHGIGAVPTDITAHPQSLPSSRPENLSH
jgi:RHS repeat-associated protein